MSKEKAIIEAKLESAVKSGDRISFGSYHTQSQRINNELTSKSRVLDVLYKSLSNLTTHEYLSENNNILKQSEVNSKVADIYEIEQLVNDSQNIAQNVDSDYDKVNNIVGSSSFDNDLEAAWQKAQADLLVDNSAQEFEKKINKEM